MALFIDIFSLNFPIIELFFKRERGTGNKELGVGSRENGTGNRERGIGNSKKNLPEF